MSTTVYMGSRIQLGQGRTKRRGWTAVDGTITSLDVIVGPGETRIVTVAFNPTTAIALYMTANGRMTASNAMTATNEIQRITTSGGSGNFALTYDGQTTSNLRYDDTDAEVSAVLLSLSNIGIGDVSVAAGLFPGSIDVTFQGALAATNVPAMAVASDSGPAAVISTIAQGSAGGGGSDTFTLSNNLAIAWTDDNLAGHACPFTSSFTSLALTNLQANKQTLFKFRGLNG